MSPSATPPEPPHFLDWTAADWSIVASIFTIVGVLIALFGGLLALLAHQNTNRLASHAHMHGLLRDYLRARFDYQVALMSAAAGTGSEPGDPRAAQAARARKTLKGEVASLKLYVLEEMWEWMDGQRKLTRLRLAGPREDRQALDVWRATIVAHITDDAAAVIKDLTLATDCYGLGFLEFLACEFKDKRPFAAKFAAILAHQNKLVGDGKPRAPMIRRSPRRRAGPDSPAPSAPEA